MAKDPDPHRPRIWAAGDQKSVFNIKAFGRASVVLARDDISRLLGFSGHHIGNGGAAVIGGWGRIPPDRLTRVKAILPSHVGVGRAIQGFGNLLSGSGQSILPAARRSAMPKGSRAGKAPATASSPLTEADALTPADAEMIARFAVPAPQSPPDPLAPAAGPSDEDHTTLVPPAGDTLSGADPASSDPDLAAIRSMMFDTPVKASPAREARNRVIRNSEITGDTEAAPPETAQASGGSALGQLTAMLLGHGLWGIALPYGAVRAGICHLSGQDLADIARDE